MRLGSVPTRGGVGATHVGSQFEREARRRYQRDPQETGDRPGAVRELDVLLEVLSATRTRLCESASPSCSPTLKLEPEPKVAPGLAVSTQGRSTDSP